MATKAEIEFILEHLERVNPIDFFRILDENNVGAGAVLRYLYESKGDVTAGNISDFMHVSTARVAVLLKRMMHQGLITKESDASDARITIVRITPAGEEKVRQIRDTIYANTCKVIDSVGMEKITEFLSISDEIRAVIAPQNKEEL